MPAINCGCNSFPATLGDVTFGASVGIGMTTNPSAPLEVDGGGELLRLSGAAAPYYLTLRTGATQYGQLGIGDSGQILTGQGPNSLAVRAETSLHLGSGGDGLTLTVAGGGGGNPGQVGIGTTGPTYTLHVHGADAAGSGLYVDTAGYANLPPTLGVEQGVILNARGLTVAGDGASLAAGPTAGVGIAVSRAGAALGVRNQGGYAAIFEAGYVGIGTTSPQQALDVAGTVRCTGALLGGDQLMSGALKDSTGNRTNVDSGGCYYAS